MSEPGKKLVAPDGGWGWMIVLGASLINLVTRSIEPSFGLLFGDFLKDLQVETTGASVIMAALDATINFSGLFVGPLIKKYSYRKVGVVGGLLSAIALSTTTLSHSVISVIITYSIIGGIGFGLLTATAFVALNSYFDKRRGQAVGLAMAGTALGFMTMPQIVSLLLEYYDFRGTLLILSALSLNTLVGAGIMQPVKWHMKPEEKSLLEEELQELTEVPDIRVSITKEGNLNRNSTDTTAERMVSSISVASAAPLTPATNLLQRQISQPVESNFSPFRPSLALSREGSFVKVSGSSNGLDGFKRQSSFKGIPQVYSSASMVVRHRKTSIISNVSHVDFMGSTMHFEINEENEDEDDRGMEINFNNIESNEPEKKLTKDAKRKNTNLFRVLLRRFILFMDFDLLKDIVYLNILLGLSITYVAELNFKTVIPFYMNSLGYGHHDIANALTVMAIADISARVIIPPILDRLPYSRRSSFIFGTVFLIISRSLLAEQKNWTPLLMCFISNGFFRGVTLINVPLILSEYAPKDKFPAALGLSMVAKGLFIVILGPLLGYIRDVSDSYPLCIHSQSILIFICLFTWSLEYLIKCNRRKVQSLQNNSEA